MGNTVVVNKGVASVSCIVFLFVFTNSPVPGVKSLLLVAGIHQVCSELLMSQFLPVIMLFTSLQLTKMNSTEFFVFYFPPIILFYAKGRAYVFPDWDMPPSFSDFPAICPYSSSLASTLVPQVGWLTFQGLRLHCALPTEMPLPQRLCSLPRFNHQCNWKHFFIEWLFSSFTEIYLFFIVLKKKLEGKVFMEKVQLFYHFPPSYPSSFFYFLQCHIVIFSNRCNTHE